MKPRVRSFTERGKRKWGIYTFQKDCPDEFVKGTWYCPLHHQFATWQEAIDRALLRPFNR